MSDITVNKEELEYRVGPLMYMPALRRDIKEKLTGIRSMGVSCVAVCLEDTICSDKVPEAEKNLAQTFQSIYEDISSGALSPEALPYIFIRVRETAQIKRVKEMCGIAFGMISGIIFPKTDGSNIAAYTEECLNTDSRLLMMPIIESPSLLNPYRRYASLQTLYDTVCGCKDSILNIRVGGNDFSNAVGICADVYHTVYDIAPVAALLADITAFFTADFTVSAPVWNYFDGDNWAEGMKKEMDKDRYYGFIGKTVIHPNQISVALECMKIPQREYEAARLVVSSHGEIQAFGCGGRMYENLVHTKWAEKTIKLADIYGIQEEGDSL